MSGVFNIIGNAKSAVISGISTVLTAIQTAVEIIDDWDLNDRCKTSPIPSQDGVTGGAGTVDAGTQRVVSATDDPGVVSLALIDNTIVADDAIAPSEGNMGGLLAKTAQKTAVSGDGDLVQPVANEHGEQVIAGHTWATNSNRFSEIDPLDLKIDSVSLIDTTDLAADTHYYPSSNGFDMDGYKDLSLSGRMNDPDGTFTLTVEVTNDEDLVSGIWHDVTKSGYRPDTNTTDNADITVTNGSIDFTFDFDNLDYRYARIVVVNDGATNTISIKARRKAL